MDTEEKWVPEERYMELALELAKKGAGFTSPNPMVGALIVKDGQIIGQGYHARYGELHAERSALAACTQSPQGADLYVTLEPCCHYGKQPPCVDAILEAGIRRVAVGAGDPNPKVAGKGIRILREHGVEVAEHVLEAECLRINEVFFHYIRTGTPFVTMKYAMTLDGKIASFTGASKWITGEAARQHVHEQRGIASAIMVGVGTVLQDDPLLTCRAGNLRSPLRIVCDTLLRTPLTSRIARTAGEVPTVLATCCADGERLAPYRQMGCEILVLSQKDGHVDLRELMNRLGQRGIDSVIVEGGAALNWSVLREGLVQKVQTYLAPKLLGGEGAKSPVGGEGFASPDLAVHVKSREITRLGEDILIESEVE